jgi:hypothetical protein
MCSYRHSGGETQIAAVNLRTEAVHLTSNVYFCERGRKLRLCCCTLPKELCSFAFFHGVYLDSFAWR